MDISSKTRCNLEITHFDSKPRLQDEQMWEKNRRIPAPLTVSRCQCCLESFYHPCSLSSNPCLDMLPRKWLNRAKIASIFKPECHVVQEYQLMVDQNE